MAYSNTLVPINNSITVYQVLSLVFAIIVILISLHQCKHYFHAKRRAALFLLSILFVGTNVAIIVLASVMSNDSLLVLTRMDIALLYCSSVTLLALIFMLYLSILIERYCRLFMVIKNTWSYTRIHAALYMGYLLSFLTGKPSR
jgi:hypothetical protein